ncbi:MAG: hypothetical protein LBK69_03420 [Syntrophomonadaceae bacterium]|jgi:hypothetical protein|nr:hypothetical protein [Syntrophomonadaceae bacterium]
MHTSFRPVLAQRGLYAGIQVVFMDSGTILPGMTIVVLDSGTVLPGMTIVVAQND